MNDPAPKRVLSGDVLPPLLPEQTKVPNLPPETPFGLPILARAKYEARTKAFRAYVEFRNAQKALLEQETSLLSTVQDRLRAQEQLAVALQRHEHLDKILLAEEATLLAELDDLFESIADKVADKRDNKADKELQRRIARANLEADALEAEARLARIKNPPKAEPAAGPQLSRAARVAREIARIKKDSEELRQALVEAAGGEDKLTEEDRAHLDTIALATENQIRELIESL
jgi:hypothetical protein